MTGTPEVLSPPRNTPSSSTSGVPFFRCLKCKAEMEFGEACQCLVEAGREIVEKAKKAQRARDRLKQRGML